MANTELQPPFIGSCDEGNKPVLVPLANSAYHMASPGQGTLYWVVLLLLALAMVILYSNIEAEVKAAREDIEEGFNFLCKESMAVFGEKNGDNEKKSDPTQAKKDAAKNRKLFINVLPFPIRGRRHNENVRTVLLSTAPESVTITATQGTDGISGCRTAKNPYTRLSDGAPPKDSKSPERTASFKEMAYR